jgi:hypothetical protein
MNDPIFSSLNSKCASVACVWTWDESNSDWYMISDPCSSGCSPCPYPINITGSINGDTTTTYCT